MAENDIVGINNIKITRIKQGKAQSTEDQVIIEQPLEIRIRHRDRLSQVAITMRTPGFDQNLAIGFLFTEGIITDISSVINTILVAENVIEVCLTDSSILPDGVFQRNTFMSSSCGICGKASLDLIKTNTQYLPWSSKFKVSIDIITSLRSKLDDMQSLFSITGGNHAVALFDLRANLIYIAEDVGRHNAMDKLIGHELQNNKLPLNNSICLLSGRASFELVQKAMMAGIGCIVAVGAPSSLAIELAEESGMTLIGFLKSDGGNIYCGEGRVKL